MTHNLIKYSAVIRSQGLETQVFVLTLGSVFLFTLLV
jgi:hypothetical protein